MRITIEYNGAEARVKTNLPPELRILLSNNLAYIDSSKEYLSRIKGFNISDTRVNLFNGRTQGFPRGLLQRVEGLLTNLGHEVKLVQIHPAINPVPVEYPDWTYPHQKAIAEHGWGTKYARVESPTGSGKTRSMVVYLSAFPTANCLVVVPGKNLLGQTAKVLQQFLGERVGMIGDGHKRWERVTVGIINSLANLAKQDDPHLRAVQIMIYDECHGAGTKSSVQLSSACVNTDYRLGLSATNFRADGATLALEGVLGSLVASIEPMELANNGLLVKPLCLRLPVPDPELVYDGASTQRGKDGKVSYGYDTPNGKPDVQVVIRQAIVNNQARNQLIIDVVERLLKVPDRKGSVLILVEARDHGVFLTQLAAKRGIEIPYIHGDTPMEDREVVVNKLKSRELDVVCGTRILNVGQDIPSLEYVIVACGGAGEIRVIQQLGRVVRTCSETGKTRAVLIDFDDQESYYLANHAYKRQQAIEGAFPMTTRYIELNDLEEALAYG